MRTKLFKRQPGNQIPFRYARNKALFCSLAAFIVFFVSTSYVFPQDKKLTTPKTKQERASAVKPTDTGGTAMTEIGEKFCDVEVKDGTISVFDYVFNGQKYGGEIRSDRLKPEEMQGARIFYFKDQKSFYVITDYKIVFFKLAVQNGTLRAGIFYSAVMDNKINPESIVSKDNSFLLLSTKNQLLSLVVGGLPTDTADPIQGFSFDGSRFFTHEDAIYEDPTNGIFVATTPTTLFVHTPKGINLWEYSEMVEGMQPISHPKIDIESGWIRIRDPTIFENGISYKLLIDARADTLKCRVREESVAVQPLSSL